MEGAVQGRRQHRELLLHAWLGGVRSAPLHAGRNVRNRRRVSEGASGANPVPKWDNFSEQQVVFGLIQVLIEDFSVLEIDFAWFGLDRLTRCLLCEFHLGE